MEMASATEKLNSYFILINFNLKMYLIFLKKIFSSMFGTAWVCEFTFSTVNFVNSEYRSNISSKNLVSDLSCQLDTRFQRPTMGKKNVSQ